MGPMLTHPSLALLQGPHLNHDHAVSLLEGGEHGDHVLVLQRAVQTHLAEDLSGAAKDRRAVSFALVKSMVGCADGGVQVKTQAWRHMIFIQSAQSCLLQGLHSALTWYLYKSHTALSLYTLSTTRWPDWRQKPLSTLDA